jgi:hypothetical protein
MSIANSIRKVFTKKNWYSPVLILGTAIQIVIVVNFVFSWGKQIFLMRDMTPIQKSALTTWTAEFSEYIQFLREEIPEDAKVILPPNNSSPPIDNLGYMQYLLYPREIHNCGLDEIEACVLRASGSNTFILSYHDFPPRELAGATKRLIEFSHQFGLFVPKQIDQ